jgi:hypothetical protein
MKSMTTRMEHASGIEAARLLFDNGLWFDGVVRGLVAELGYTEERARGVARAALAERLDAEAVTSPTRNNRLVARSWPGEAQRGR